MHHLGVIVNIDNINRPMSITDEEDGVIIGLQHFQQVNICPTVDENKITKLKQNKNNH